MSKFEGKSKARVNTSKLLVGVSSCLLGEAVRYDGGHKAHADINGALTNYFEFRSFCPEVDIGMGIPRQPIRLVRNSQPHRSWSDSPPDVIPYIAVDAAAFDHSPALRDCAAGQRQWHERLCGYIFKQDSPSCGTGRVKIWDGAEAVREGVGIYADRLMKNYPFLPIAQERELEDKDSRENFIQSVTAMGRWHELQNRGFSLDQLLEFHQHYRPILMSRDRCGIRKLERMLAKLSEDNLPQSASAYLIQFMALLKNPASQTLFRGSLAAP